MNHFKNFQSHSRIFNLSSRIFNLSSICSSLFIGFSFIACLSPPPAKRVFNHFRGIEGLQHVFKKPCRRTPPYPGSKRTVCVASFIFHMREHKERGGQPAPKCRVFSNFYVIFSNILPLLFCCVFAFFSVLKLIFKIFFDRFSGNFRLSRQD